MRPNHIVEEALASLFFFFLFQVGYVPSGQSRCLNMTPSLFGPFLDSFVPHQEQQTACSMICARPHSDLVFTVVSVAVITVLMHPVLNLTIVSTSEVIAGRVAFSLPFGHV